MGCSATDPGKIEIKNVFGPGGRAARVRAKDRLLADGSLAPLEGQEDLDAAQALYDDKKFGKAEKAFKGVAKKYQDKPIEENALFMMAESQFQQERFPQAQDSYNKLLHKFESSRYLEQTTQRLFAIAKIWLDSPEEVSDNEIKLATGGDDPTALTTPLKKEKRPAPLIPNLLNNRRPLFDTDGRALGALKSIWLNHPTGKLADDAIMMTAVYHMRTGDYLESERFFKMLREQYSDSNHAGDAYKLGSHVVQMGYQGASYDGQSLENAEELNKSTLNLFPDTKDKARIKRGLARIKDEKARRSWERVNYRLRRGEKISAERNCRTVIEEFPDSRFAKLAKEKLEELRAERLGQTAPVKQDVPAEPEEAPGSVIIEPEDFDEYDPEMPEFLPLDEPAP